MKIMFIAYDWIFIILFVWGCTCAITGLPMTATDVNRQATVCLQAKPYKPFKPHSSQYRPCASMWLPMWCEQLSSAAHSIVTLANNPITWGNKRTEKWLKEGTEHCISHWSWELNQYGFFPDRSNNTHPQRKKGVLIKFFLPTGPWDGFALCCWLCSKLDH